MNASRQQPLAVFMKHMGAGTGGGTQRVNVTLANEFVARGIPVDFVLVQARGPYLERLDPRVHVIDLKAANMRRSLRPLISYLRERRPAAMLSAENHCNVIALIAKRISRAPLRLVISEHIVLSIHAKNAAHVPRTIVPLVRWTYPWADAIVGVSQGVVTDLAEITGIPAKDMHTIYNPVPPGIAEAAALDCDHPWISQPDAPVFVNVGRLSYQKNHELLIRAFARVQSADPSRLIILGEGDERENLTSLTNSLHLSERVDMPGFVSNPFPYMARCSAFVLSSRWEGFALVLIEALACGAQIVSTDCRSGPREVTRNGEFGRLVEVGDEIALASAMSNALRNPIPSAVLRARSEDFSPDRIASQYLNVLDYASA